MDPSDKPAWLKDAPDGRPTESRTSATRPMPLLFDAEHRRSRPSRPGTVAEPSCVRAWETSWARSRVPGPSIAGTIVRGGPARGRDPPAHPLRDRAGLAVEGYLLRPDRPGRGRPGVVVLHSTADWTIRQPAGLEGPADLHIGLQLARRGYVAICPRCFLWEYRRGGKLETAVDWLRARHPGVTGMAKMLYDASRAVDLLAAMEDVDARRIGAIGHSLGAKEVLYLAAFDERVRAAVSSEGGIGLTYSNWDAPWYLGEAIRRPGIRPGPRSGPGPGRAAGVPPDRRRLGGRRPELAVHRRGVTGVEAGRGPGGRGPVQPSPRTCLPAGSAIARRGVARLVPQHRRLTD